MPSAAFLDRYDAQIDRAFGRWLETALPPPLRAVALALPHRIGLARAPRWRSWRGVFRSPLMRALPGLVAEAFPSVRGARLRELGLAHVLLAFVAFLDDRLNDGQTPFTREVHLVRRMMEAEVARLLGGVVGGRADFWRRARRQSLQHAAAHAHERNLWSGTNGRYTHRQYARDAAGKIAIAQAPAVAVALAGGASAGTVTQLTRVFDNCLIALQYRDDVADWAEDYRSGRWTYFVLRHLRPLEAQRRRPLTVAALQTRVAGGSITDEFLERAMHHYDAALGGLGGLAMPALQTWIGQRRDEVQHALSIRRQPLHRALRRCWLQ